MLQFYSSLVSIANKNLVTNAVFGFETSELTASEDGLQTVVRFGTRKGSGAGRQVVTVAATSITATSGKLKCPMPCHLAVFNLLLCPL